ncbi:MAG: two-component regulator propeller domain-containing protein [Candidatus Pseudobacter hemicellulosilyticus]|uniref:histidine kinase n=1 Tax=Candidatus Pseudobacter hemicellulosilyticus TaxID=3121375 RepID=A0AAJ5WP03_9BACT|nr:MAG: two-component regulator propeller domain-containing protein [Pseudobacter sp.]
MPIDCLPHCRLLSRLLLLAGILCVHPFGATDVFAQQPHISFKHIQNEQGLSNSTIECIFQDSRGFLWFGTRDGLNRYDGYQLTVYRYDPKDPGSISDNYIKAIQEDSNKVLWVGTTNGLNRLDAASGQFTRFKHDASQPNSLPNNQVNTLFKDDAGQLWAGTAAGGLTRVRVDGSGFDRFPLEQLAPGEPVQVLYEDSKHNSWIGTGRQLYRYNRQTDALSVYPLTGAFSIRAIHEDQQGNIWVGTEDDGLFVIDLVHQQTTRYRHSETDPGSLGSNQVRSILSDRQGNVWIGSINGGLQLFNPPANNFWRYQYEEGNPASLSQRTVSALLEDSQGNLWIGTHRGGINLYTPGTEKFKLYRQTLSASSLSYNDVKAFCEDSQGVLWIGTDGGGLNKMDRSRNQFTHYKYNPFDAGSIGSNEVLHVMEDSEGNLWAGTWGGGLNLLNRATGRFTRFTHQPSDPGSISSNYVQKIYEDRQHNLWIATYYGGLNLFDRKTRRFTRITKDPQGQTSLSGNNIVSIQEDAAGNLWIGTDDGGLNCYDPITRRFSHYFTNDDKLPDLRVIFSDSKQRLWIGQVGLYLFDPVKKTFSLFTNKAGLGAEFIKGMAEDKKGTFWIATSNGLTQWNPDNGQWKKYNTGDGLQGLEFEANAYLQTRAGELFFGGINGFNSFYPAQIRSNNFLPPVYLTELQVFNRTILPGPKSPLQEAISLAKTITLSYDQTAFSLSFAALNYTATENNQYAYKLDGWDKDWNYVGHERKASYTNLDPGSYTFHVKAANNDGIWNEQPTTITIIIRPPFWKTWWFQAIVLGLLLYGILAWYRFRQQQQLHKLEEQKREELHRLQLQLFTNISHEFRTPLSLILGSLEQMQKETPRSASSHHYKIIFRNISRLTGLINELMDFRKVESGALELKVMPGNIGLFLRELADEFSELAIQKNIQFSVAIPEGLPPAWFDRQVLEKIVLNLVSNAFKYTTDGGKISLEVLNDLTGFKPSFGNELLLPNEYQPGSTLYIRVADNGIGISKESIRHLFERYYKISESHLGSGIGLAFVKSLTQLHKGGIHVYSERNEGTEIIIALPVGEADYTAAEQWEQNHEEAGVRLESIHYKYEQQLPAVDRHAPHIPAAPARLHGHAQPQPASGAAVTDPAESNMPVNTEPIGSSQKQMILLVEDSDELRTFLKESLQGQYNVLEAANGQEALEHLEDSFPDLIISDVMMPVMDGIELCRQVKDNVETSHIPFLMLTSRDSLEAQLEGVGSGADFYFAKPISVDLLQLTIRNIFDQRQKLKERYAQDQFAEARDMVHSARDKVFMDQLLSIIEAQLTNPDMDVDYICQQAGMSRTKLYQKIKSITGQSIGEFVRSVRLRHAVKIMTEEDVPLTEVTYRVGIQTQSYFTKAFKKEFGKTPSQFLQELKK